MLLAPPASGPPPLRTRLLLLRLPLRKRPSLPPLWPLPLPWLLWLPGRPPAGFSPK